MIPTEKTRAAPALVLGILVALGTAPAGASGYACAVKPTADGFVALRDGPSTRHSTIGRMRGEELVGTMDKKTQDRVISGRWIRVIWYAGTRRTAFSIPDVAPGTGRTGWMHRDLINCFE